MKYKTGSVELLNSGETMYIYLADENKKGYYALDCDNNENDREIKDSDIYGCAVTM